MFIWFLEVAYYCSRVVLEQMSCQIGLIYLVLLTI